MDNICIGTAQFGMSYGIANKTGQPGKREVLEMVKTAAEQGISFYDTAAAYGKSEAVLGEIFSELGIRKKVNVITKLPPDFVFDGMENLRNTLLESIRRLCVDGLWGVMLHRTGMTMSHGFAEALSGLKNEGVLKHFGVSVYHPEDALKYAENDCVDMIQVPFNIMDRRLLDNGFFEAARLKKKAVFIRSVFLQGLLLMDEPSIIEKKMEWTLPFVRPFHDFIKEQAVDAKAFMVQAAGRKSPHAKMVIGMENHGQIMENIALFQSGEIQEACFEKWWAGLPVYPERLVNPALW